MKPGDLYYKVHIILSGGNFYACSSTPIEVTKEPDGIHIRNATWFEGPIGYMPLYIDESDIRAISIVAAKYVEKKEK